MSEFEAKYGGTCGSCDERIRVGELVTYDEDVLVHAECEAAARMVRNQDVCGTCWLVKPCDCEDRR